MLVNDFDFVAQLEDELTAAREQAARSLDRATALAELRSHALAVAAELRRPLRAADVLQPRDPHDEETRARLSALVDRITREEP